MRILITGVAGNIGSELADRLLKDSRHQVFGVDNFSTGNRKKLPANSPKNFTFFQVDVNDLEGIRQVMENNDIEIVFHYAATVGVKRTLENPLLVLNDIQGIRNILELSRQGSIRRIFFSSSSEVYGEPVEFPQNEETTPLNSRLPYAIVKNVGEAFLRSYHKAYNLPFTIFRFFNTYGPRQSEDFVISKFIKLALANQDITIYGDGQQSRTFCYIDDNIETTIRCLENGFCLNEVMNIGSDREYPIKDLARLIVQITGSQSRIIHLPPLTEGDMTRRKPDITKMKSILGRDLIPLEVGIKRIAESFMRP